LRWPVAGLGAFVRGRAEHGGQLGLDQGLVDRLRGLTDAVAHVGSAQCFENVDQCRLVQGHRDEVPPHVP
jgi:hypothetical protein